MTHQKVDLVLTFLQSHPDFAAGLIEEWSIEDAAAFIKSIPLPEASLVLGHMLPHYTARICMALEPGTAAGFLSHMDNRVIAAVLRYTNKTSLRNLLKELPVKTRTTCKLLLNYAEDTAGAWMLPQTAAVPIGCTVEEALKRLAEEQDTVVTDVVCVVDRENQMRGVTGISTLLRTKPEIPIELMMRKNPDTISGHSALSSVQQHDGWICHDTLPVVNRSKQMIGMLRHMDMRNGMRQTSSTIPQSKTNTPLTEIFEVYGGSLLALFSTLGGLSNRKSQ
ncbi:MAG: magnesium transporter [SAR324 cluster bacterium]|nr:magnesium transporter [SAR324 cluster bacterium]